MTTMIEKLRQKFTCIRELNPTGKDSIYLGLSSRGVLLDMGNPYVFLDTGNKYKFSIFVLLIILF